MKYNSYQCDVCLGKTEAPCVIFTESEPKDYPHNGKVANWTLLYRGEN